MATMVSHPPIRYKHVTQASPASVFPEVKITTLEDRFPYPLLYSIKYSYEQVTDIGNYGRWKILGVYIAHILPAGMRELSHSLINSCVSLFEGISRPDQLLS